MRNKYIATCSFGKDSLATILLAHEHNEPLDEIVYTEVIFATEREREREISGEYPEHIAWIKSVAIPRIKELMGIDVTILKGRSYIEMFHKVKTKGKHIGDIYGFPPSKPFGCYMNSNGKARPIERYFKNNKNAIIYEGLAIDEPERLERMKANRYNHISLLEKYGYTEQMAYELCKKYNLLSPIYSTHHRNGCWFCPNASINHYVWLKREHPDLYNELKSLSKEEGVRLFTCNKTFEYVDERVSAEIGQLSLF